MIFLEVLSSLPKRNKNEEKRDFEYNIYFSKPSHKLNQLLSLFGFMLIIMSVVFFDNRIIPPFPNIYTLIPACGAGLIILYGEKNTLIGHLLSTTLCRWIGLISYSLYLWHQPLLAFVRLYPNEISENLMIIIVLSLVFPLSILSYLFIEQPFRNKERFSRKEIFLLSGLCSIIILFVGLFLIRTSKNRLSIMDKEPDSYLSDLNKYGNWQYVVRDFDQLAREKKTFSSKTSNKTQKIVLIGDSFAQDFYNMIIEGKHLKNSDICVYFISSRCQIYLGNEDRAKFIEAQHKQTCTNAYDIKYALPLIRQANIIFLSSNWYLWSSIRLPNTLKLLNITKQQQIFVIGPKHFGKVNTKLYINKTKQFRIKQYQYPKPEVIQINDLLEKTIDKSIYVNIPKLICKGSNQTCPLFTPDGKLISHDGAHLTKYGARYIGNIIFNNKPLNQLKSL